MPDSDRLGIYPDRGALDHDTDALIRDHVLSELSARGVDHDVALAAIRRWARDAS
jgi:hypothetical protein